MPLSLTYPSSIPLRYHLLHDSFALALHAADVALTALLLHFFYTQGALVYFITLLSLIAVALMCGAIFFSLPFSLSSPCFLMLGIPFAYLSPFVIVPSYYALPSSLPHCFHALLHCRPSLCPHTHPDPMRGYLLYKLTQHASLHLHAVLFTFPASVVLLVYCASHSAELTWLHTATLLTQLTVLCTRMQSWTFSVHAGTMLAMILALAMDVVNAYAYVLLLASSTPGEAWGVRPYFFSAYTHSTPLNVAMLDKDMTLFLLFALTFVLLLAAFALKDLHMHPAMGWRVVGITVVKWWLGYVSGVTLFVPLVLALKVMKMTWLVIALYIALETQVTLWPVFYRRLHHFLVHGGVQGVAAEGVDSADAGDVRSRLFLANQFFASKALTLYPPPACINGKRRHYVAHALHTLSLTPQTFDVDALKALEMGENPPSLRSAFTLLRLNLFSQFPPLPQSPALWNRVMQVTGIVVFYLCLPLYVVSVLWDILYPLAAGVWLGVTGGWGSGVERLALIVVCVYAAMFAAVALLLPSVMRFHRLMDQVIMYELPQQQALVEANTKDVPDAAFQQHSPPSSPSSSLVRHSHAVGPSSAPPPCPPSPPWSLADDHLSDWPFQLSSLLYSSHLAHLARRHLLDDGLPADLCTLVISYLPEMERERASTSAEEMEWKERRRTRRRERRAHPVHYQDGLHRMHPWRGRRGFDQEDVLQGGGRGFHGGLDGMEMELDIDDLLDLEDDHDGALRLQRQVTASVEMGHTRPRHFHQWQREPSLEEGEEAKVRVRWEEEDDGAEQKERPQADAGEEKERCSGVMHGVYDALVQARERMGERLEVKETSSSAFALLSDDADAKSEREREADLERGEADCTDYVDLCDGLEERSSAEAVESEETKCADTASSPSPSLDERHHRLLAQHRPDE